MPIPDRLTLILAIVALALASAMPARAEEPVTNTAVDTMASGCEPAHGIQVSDEYRTYEEVSMEPSEPILDGRPGTSVDEMRAAGFEAPVLGDRFGLDILHVSHHLHRRTGMGSGVIYFGREPLSAETTLHDVLISGGARVDEQITPTDLTVTERVDRLRDEYEIVFGSGRTTDAWIGTHPGLVVRGDEVVQGRRFYNVLLVTDQGHIIGLLTGVPTADEAVDQARSLVCPRPGPHPPAIPRSPALEGLCVSTSSRVSRLPSRTQDSYHRRGV